METVLQILRLALVILLVVAAGCLATPPGRLPLAMRGLYRLLRKSDPSLTPLAEAKSPVWRRILAFLLVVVAFILSLSVSVEVSAGGQS